MRAENLINDKNVVTNSIIINVFISTVNIETLRQKSNTVTTRYKAKESIIGKSCKNEKIYIEIPERYLKVRLFKENVPAEHCQNTLLNFIKKKMWDSFSENTRLHKSLEIKNFVEASLSDFYQKYNLDEDLLPSVNLKKAWHRRKGYTVNKNRHERYPV